MRFLSDKWKEGTYSCYLSTVCSGLPWWTTKVNRSQNSSVQCVHGDFF